MTITKYIAEFLEKYESMRIHTNHMPDGSDQNGLFKSPTRDKLEYNEGNCKITEHFQVYFRQGSVSDEERKESDEWLEKLVYWIDDYGFIYEYPEIDGKRSVKDIKVTGLPTPFDYEQDDIVYQMSLSITYEREREEF